jgi:hypothetical protein
MTRRIGHLDTPESCRQECARLYKLASKGEIAWQDAEKAAAVLTRLFNMNGGNSEQTEVNWGDVGKNALHR